MGNDKPVRLLELCIYCNDEFHSKCELKGSGGSEKEFNLSFGALFQPFFLPIFH